jgi:uncharacterized protein (DUF2235 family)
MNEVQRNFKRQIKEIEQQKKKNWKKEIYYDQYQKKKFVRYYNEHNILLKTEEKKSPIKIIITIVIIGITIVIITNISKYISINKFIVKPIQGNAINQNVTTQNIKIDSTKAIWENNILYVTGTITNISGKELKLIHIDINISNAKNEVIDKAAGETINIKQNEIWNFKIPINNSIEATKYTLNYTTK